MIKKRKKRVITVRIAEELLDRVDECVYRQHRSRNLWIVQAILKELKVQEEDN